MGHCKYICDKKRRTCFDLGKNIQSQDFIELCQLVNVGQCTLEEFLELGDHQVGIYDRAKIIDLFNYIKSVEPEHYAFAYCEDHLCESVFDIEREKEPVFEVGTVYNGEATHVFGRNHLKMPC